MTAEQMLQPLSSDTTPEAQHMLFQMMRQVPVWKRLALTCEMIQATRKLMLADLRRHFPQASEEELRRRLIARLLSPDEVRRAYGFDPEQEGY
ncbi:MAG: hypothetical protein H7Y30_14285 [Pyrinomonadaceae bacterium]|nr:hypothetical protein [Pyrinomonadaceae bacterium]